MKKHLLRGVLVFTSLVFAIAAFELYLRYFGEEAFDISSMYLKRHRPENQRLRLHLEKNKYHKFDFKHDGELIYRQEVETDEWGRRKSLKAILSPKVVLFFGCSYTFGSGLQQHETLPYLFSKKTSTDSFNYAIPAYGPHGVLRQAEVLPLSEQIPSSYSDVYAIYMFYGFQWRRTIGSPDWIAKIGGSHPFYKIDPVSSQAIYQGTFAEARPISTFFIDLVSYFHIVQYLPKIWQIGETTEEDRKLFCGIMNKNYKTMHAKIGDRFKRLTIVHPFFKHDSHWSRFLLNSKTCLDPEIDVIEIKMEGERSQWSIHPIYEDHPNFKYNQYLSGVLAQEWQERQKTQEK